MIGVGCKVVCIESCTGESFFTDEKTSTQRLPKKGEIFVVSAMYVYPPPQGLGIRLIGCPALDPVGRETFWNSFKFRELEYQQSLNELAYRRDEQEKIKV